MTVAYKVEHNTRFVYPIPVSVCHNVVCLMPRPSPLLTVQQAQLTITPKPTVVNKRIDSFGNITHAFSIEEAHDAMQVNATTHLQVDAPSPATRTPGLPWEEVARCVADQTDIDWQQASRFLFNSQLVSRIEDARDYALLAFQPGRPIIEAAMDLTRRINTDFEYRPGATHVGTTSNEALAHRRGVCQDFAHAQIAAMRSIGLPVRYVSGYLRTVPPAGKPRLIGADQSHAWVSVYVGSEVGWVDMDPTNAIACGTDHIPIAIGRDYADIAPIRGAFLGGGESQLSVTVDVAQLPM